MWPAKINLEIDFGRLEIQFVELDFYNFFFQKSSTDQQGVRKHFSYLVRKKSLALLKLNLAVEGVSGEKAGPHSHVGEA